jgi:peptidoglycan/LPS O-acetylase OafA/YrhL
VVAANKRRDIQALRAIAVVLVVAYHLPGGWHLGGGFVGVDVFFAISGYVITESILRSSRATLMRPRFFLDFMSKRCRRLVPALSVAIAASVVIVLIFAPAAQIRGDLYAALTSLFFVSNFWFLRNFDSYWNPELEYNPFLHMWSLAVEFQVYLVFPIVFVLGMRLLRGLEFGRTLRLTAVAISSLSLISLGTFLYLLYGDQSLVFGENPASVAFYSPFSRFWEFGAGAAVALLARDVSTPTAWKARLIKVVAGCVAVASLLGLGAAGAIGWWVMPAIASTCVFLALPTRHQTSARPIAVALAALVWLGDRSYSVYLWHWPLLALLIWRGATQPWHIVVALAGTLVAADLSYRLVEQGQWPSRAYLTRLSRLSRPVWAFGLALVVLGGGFVFLRSDIVVKTGTSDAVATPFPPSEVNATDATLPMYDCGELGPETHCDNAGPDAPEIVVIGDSLGYRLLPAVQYVAKQNDLNVTMFWAGGCGIEFLECPENAQAYIRAHRVAAVVVAQNYAFASTVVNGAEMDSGMTPICPAGARTIECPAHREVVRAFTERAAEGLRALTEITPNVLVALPFPQQARSFPSCLTQRQSGGGKGDSQNEACGWTSVDWQRERQGLFPTAVRSVAERYPGVLLWDPVKIFCVDERCPAAINDGEVVMDDAIHMTMEASRYAIPTIADFVARALEP